MSKSSDRSEVSGNNRLLADLSNDEREGLASNCETVLLLKGMVLYEQGSAVPFVYFPLSAVISLLTILEDGSSVEVAAVGNEGAVGLTA
jgi:hypothetical protein